LQFIAIITSSAVDRRYGGALVASARRAGRSLAALRLVDAAGGVVLAIEIALRAVAALRVAVIVVFALGGIAAGKAGGGAAAAAGGDVAAAIQRKIRHGTDRRLDGILGIGVLHAFIPELEMGIDRAQDIRAHDHDPQNHQDGDQDIFDHGLAEFGRTHIYLEYTLKNSDRHHFCVENQFGFF
jgi:hypothetical protein